MSVDRQSEEDRLKALAPPCLRHGRHGPKSILWNVVLGVRFVLCGVRGCDAILLQVENA